MDNCKIYTYSILYSTTEAFAERLPYLTAILEATDGTRFASLIEGYQLDSKVLIGQTVRYLGSDANGRKRYAL